MPAPNDHANPPLLGQQGDPRSGLLQIARNPLERAAAIYLQQLRPRRLIGCSNWDEKKFLFRCCYVPVYGKFVIDCSIGRLGITPFLLHDYTEYVAAMERMTLEMVLGQGIDKLKKRPPKSLVDFFANLAEGYPFWTRRFDEWRASVGKSFRHFMKKQAPDIKKGGAVGSAAYLGNLLSRSGRLPNELLSEAFGRIEQSEFVFSVLRKNALKPQPARWGEAELDTWLIEIWPLVRMYGWNFYDVWQVAVQRWAYDRAWRETLHSVPKIEERCKKMLSLHLGPGGQTKGGRPKELGKKRKTQTLISSLRTFGSDEESKPAPMPGLALAALLIKSIGMDKEKWISMPRSRIDLDPPLFR